MPFLRLAIAAALTLVLVIPSAASAQTPQQVDMQIAALRTSVDVRTKQIDAFRQQAAMARGTVAGAVVAAILQPRIDELLRANELTKHQLEDLTNKRALFAQAQLINARNGQLAALNQQLTVLNSTPGANAAQKELLRDKVESLSASAQDDMFKLQALMNQYTDAMEMLSSMMQKFAQTQDQIARNLR